MQLKWRWLFWQVVVPIAGPMVISAIVAALWWTGSKNFKVDWRIIVDMTPWALTFYAITLIGATMNDVMPDFSARPGIGTGLIVAAIGVCIYTGMMVVWRHDPSFTPGPGVWIATLIFTIASIGLCHTAEA
jgi:hypothetical protein